jgi:hypothetical protein
MTHPVKLDESANPEGVRAFGAYAVMARTEFVSEAREQPEIPTSPGLIGMGAMRGHGSGSNERVVDDSLVLVFTLGSTIAEPDRITSA